MEPPEMSQNVTRLTGRQQRAAQMIAKGFTLRNLAKKLKIRHETITRWNKNPAFKAEYDRLVA